MAMVTLQGRIVRANPAFAAMLGRTAGELVGRWYRDFTPHDAPAVDEALRGISAGQEIAASEHDLTGEVGTQRVQVALSPVRGHLDRVLYIFLQAQDLTTQRALEAKLRSSEERFRLLVEAVQDYAIFMLDREEQIASWNQGAHRITGYTGEEVIGQHFRIFYTPEAQQAGHPEHELNTASREGRYEEVGVRVRKGGARYRVHVILTPIFSEDGEHMGFAKVTRTA